MTGRMTFKKLRCTVTHVTPRTVRVTSIHGNNDKEYGLVKSIGRSNLSGKQDKEMDDTSPAMLPLRDIELSIAGWLHENIMEEIDLLAEEQLDL